VTCSLTLATIGTFGIVNPKSPRLTMVVAVPLRRVALSAVTVARKTTGFVVFRMVRLPAI